MSETSLVNKNQHKRINIYIVYSIVVVAISLLIRWVLIILGKVPFNSDEAVVGIMASHILKGASPVFFYGQAYMGSLDSYIVAAFFGIFGESIAVLRVSQSLVYVLFMFFSFIFARTILHSNKSAAIVLILLAFPPVYFLLYTTVSLGGYIEALILGLSTLLLGYKLESLFTGGNLPDKKRNILFSLTMGFCIGSGIWVLGITLVFSISSLILLLKSYVLNKIPVRHILVSGCSMLIGVAAGLLPVWYFLISHDGNIFVQELLGSAINIHQVSYLSQIGAHLTNLLLFGTTVIFGFRPPWGITWLFLPLIPIILFLWIFIIGRSIKTDKNYNHGLLLRIWLPSIILYIAFIFTPFGVDPSGRYFLPVYISMALTVGYWVTHETGIPKKITTIALVLLCSYQLSGIIQSAIQSPNGITTQFAPDTSIDHDYDKELIKFLIDSGNTRGYSTYWVSYPIIFQSKEEVILVPVLPYHSDLRHTIRDDRYKPYHAEVDRSDNKVYITANNQNLDRYLRQAFISNGVTWREEIIGEYIVYHSFSRSIMPEEIDMGINRQ